MRAEPRQCGLTLTEMTVVVAIVAMLVVFGLPAIRALLSSFETQGGTKAMISAALASARAIAAKERHYAGIRFQNRYREDNKGCQYMIFIIHDPDPHGTDLANGFRAVKGINPIKLPDNVGVMDLKLGSTAQDIDSYDEIDDDWELTDTTTFSIVFSPSGKLVIHDVQVRNKDGKPKGNNSSEDDIFNTRSNVTNLSNPVGMFIQDDYDFLGLTKEPSRNEFIIYDRADFDKLNRNRRYDDYLRHLEVIHINPYTGTMINK